MKRHILFFISLSLPLLLIAQEADLTKKSFMKVGAVDAARITVEGHDKNVDAVLQQWFKEKTGEKGKKTKGMRVYEGVILKEISDKTLDIYYDLNKAGTKEVPSTEVSLFISLGNESIMDPDLYPNEMDNAIKMLNALPKDVKIYELELAIEDQNKTLEKTIKEYEKMGRDSVNLQQRLVETQQAIEQNIVDRQQQRVSIKTEEGVLEEFKARLKAIKEE